MNYIILKIELIDLYAGLMPCINLNITHKNCFNPVRRIIDYHFQRIENLHKKFNDVKNIMRGKLFLIFNCGSPTS